VSPVGARSYTEPNHTSSWRKRLKAPPTHLSIAATKEQNRSRYTETSPLTTRVAGRALLRRDHSRPSAGFTLSLRVDDSFTPLKLPIQDVFEAIKGQPWVKHPEAKQHDSACPGVKDYCSFHDSKRHLTSECQSLRSTLRILSSRAISESTSSHSEPPPR